MVEKWIPLLSSDSACRKILANEIKEYSIQRFQEGKTRTRWILNLSWDRGSSNSTGLVKEGDSLFFNSFTEMAEFISKYIDSDINICE